MPSPSYKPDTLRAQFDALEEVLLALASLWKPQPFKQRRPGWCVSHPELTEALLALDGEAYDRLFHNDEALQSFLAQYVADFSDMRALTRLPESPIQTRRAERHLDWEIPGRKWQQIDRFSRAIGMMTGPVLEWCGGKGHLGRVLAMRNQVPVTTLEHNGELCAEGERLAERAGVRQVFRRVDVLSPLSPTLDGAHAVALHACGELHRTLLRKVIAEGQDAVDIAPCCYHLGGAEGYQAFNEYSRLQLVRDDLRLAVTGSATSSPREVRLRDREMAWKLGFIELRKDLQNDESYQNLRPVDKRWLKAGFEDFCHALASRENLELATGIDWQHYETFGWRRQREVMRLSLPRHAVRRALELWLVLDMALELQQHGYDVHLQTFCPTHISPRNILLSARRPPVAGE